MLLIVSGEGPTDIGTCTNAQGRCSGFDFKPGPMGVMVDKIAEDEIGHAPHEDQHSMDFVSKQECARLAKELRINKKHPTFLATGKSPLIGFHYKMARALARLAKNETAQDQVPRGVVFFRDADGTNSTERGRYKDCVRSMESGFELEAFEFGVPMVPKPKSEAWLICALQKHAYQNCAALEESLSGNDNAPEPAKEQLETLLTERGKSVADLADLVGEGVVDALRAEMKEMPSFNDFDQRLREVLRAMQRHQP